MSVSLFTISVIILMKIQNKENSFTVQKNLKTKLSSRKVHSNLKENTYNMTIAASHSIFIFAH